MAETVRIGGGEAKIRNLWIVALLLIVTFGIYYFFWYYLIRRELRDFGFRTNDQRLASISPGMGVVAMTIGWWIIVPPFVSAWRTVRHVQHAEQVGGSSRRTRSTTRSGSCCSSSASCSSPSRSSTSNCT